jgi:hypothetical protein
MVVCEEQEQRTWHLTNPVAADAGIKDSVRAHADGNTARTMRGGWSVSSNRKGDAWIAFHHGFSRLVNGDISNELHMIEHVMSDELQFNLNEDDW